MMDKLDQEILDALQRDFPLQPRPYAVIADRLGLTEEEIWLRVQRLLDRGVIRRLGASLDSRKLGYESTLVGVRVSLENIDKATGLLDSYPDVTHCYLRQCDYNIWFTLIASSPERIDSLLADVQKELLLDDSDILNAPVERLFKLDARFPSTRFVDTH